MEILRRTGEGSGIALAAADLTGHPVPGAAGLGGVVVPAARVMPLASGGDGVAGTAVSLRGGVAPGTETGRGSRNIALPSFASLGNQPVKELPAQKDAQDQDDGLVVFGEPGVHLAIF